MLIIPYFHGNVKHKILSFLEVFDITIFAERLKFARNFRGITQKSMAEQIGIQETSYQHYEYGKREPNHEITTKIAQILKVPTDFLLGYDDLCIQLAEIAIRALETTRERYGENIEPFEMTETVFDFMKLYVEHSDEYFDEISKYFVMVDK